jgi:hypothetical protein
MREILPEDREHLTMRAKGSGRDARFTESPLRQLQHPYGGPDMGATQAVGPTLSRKNKVGLGLAAALGLFDMTSVAGMPASDGDTPGPPTGVLVAGAVIGLVTVVAVVYTWRTASRTGSRVVAGSRILSAITALPALFVTGVPAWVVLVVSVLIVVTVVVIALVLSRPAPEPVIT